MRAWIGLGANLGEPSRAFAAALSAIAALPGVRLQCISSLYRSAPVDAQGPDFLNAVARIESTRSPEALLEALQAIEADAGRRRPWRNAPRTLDLDLLLAVDAAGRPLRITSPSLTLPHPRMHARAFVLAPLAEIDPALAVPGHGSVAELLAACTGQAIERIGTLALPAGAPP
ncbi:MAG: 2-amino-4-hydroxy-6-hydroxymethyldihydropteridine diphosphokinase [Burkholderiales bacterium]|nr:2-amino-4-hydroxy-6-hydroxymethyldihydropteridine diphosphokinase [Burkholderiales bacterium]OJX04999.1 MAG: 2-amino-4-hydroxy-6-hydroxymethyldihydropteridine diphosphokinase [Burkholderiales bacterium 70-64]